MAPGAAIKIFRDNLETGIWGLGFRVWGLGLGFGCFSGIDFKLRCYLPKMEHQMEKNIETEMEAEGI